MKTFQPTPQRYLCALIACHPEALDREPYVQELARRLRYDPAIVRKEVETIANTGQAVSVCGKLRDGSEAKADPSERRQSGEPIGWLNLPQGEGEDWLDFVYRTQYRLGIAQDVVAWGQFDEWLALVAQYNEESGFFEAERLAYRKIREGLGADPLWAQFEVINKGILVELTEESEYQANDRAVADLYSGLIDAMFLYGVDWYDEVDEQIGMGRDEETALRATLLMVERLHGPEWRKKVK